MGAVCTAKHRKNSKPELYIQFLFCNMFLLFVRYLHALYSRRTHRSIAVYLLVCYVRQCFDKNLSPQSAYAFRAFGNSFMVYMVLWEQVLTPIYAINEWEAFASLEKHKRKKQRKTQGYKRMCELNKLRKKLIVWAADSAERDLYHETHCKLRSSAAVGTCEPPPI